MVITETNIGIKEYREPVAQKYTIGGFSLGVIFEASFTGKKYNFSFESYMQRNKEISKFKVG